LIAFLMTGPATNISTFGVLRSMHGSRAAWAFALGVFTFSVGFGWGVNEILGASHGAQIHDWAEQHSTWWEEGSVVLVGFLLVACLWRLGPRGFLAALVPGLPMSVREEEGECGHDGHHHDHGNHNSHGEHQHEHA
jgi:hypothetical protein